MSSQLFTLAPEATISSPNYESSNQKHLTYHHQPRNRRLVALEKKKNDIYIIYSKFCNN